MAADTRAVAGQTGACLPSLKQHHNRLLLAVHSSTRSGRHCLLNTACRNLHQPSAVPDLIVQLLYANQVWRRQLWRRWRRWAAVQSGRWRAISRQKQVRLGLNRARSLQCNYVHVVYAVQDVPNHDGLQHGAVLRREAHPMGAIRRAAQPAMSQQVARAQQRHVRANIICLMSSVTSLLPSLSSHVRVSAVQIRTKTVSESKPEPKHRSLCQEVCDCGFVSDGIPSAAVFQERCVPVRRTF